MPPGHLVAGLDAALDREIYLDHLQHAGRQIIARGQFGALFFKAAVKLLFQAQQLFLRLLQLLMGGIILQADLKPFIARDLAEPGGADL